MNVLFLCTGNSCRSILAEATFNSLAPSGWHAMSAGSQPTGQVHPRALALLAREGLSAAGLASKSWEQLPAVPDIVISVCDNAAGETCPAYLAPALRVHWGVADPAQATGSPAEIDAAFDHAYRILRARIEAFLALPLDTLSGDRRALQAEATRIGEQIPAAQQTPPCIQVYDPALCCSTGVCGVEVDQQLVNFAADVEWLKQQGGQIERFNLAQQPMAFAENGVVKRFLERSGQDGLPLILVDGEVALTGRYPQRSELARWAEVAIAAPEVPSAGACCGSTGGASGCC